MNNGLSGFNGCFIHYDRASNVFFLLNDAGTAFSGLIAGSAGQVLNSQCTLQGVGSGGTAVGSNLTVNYNLTFSAGFAGTKQIYMQAVNNTGVVEVWHQMATWTVGGATGSPASVTAAGGAGQSAAIGTAFASALKALVTDATNKPMAGVTVNFAVLPVNGAGATLASSTAVTDVSGLASIMATANGTTGSYTVNASVAGLPAVNFALTNASVSGPVITVTNAVIGQNLQAPITITLSPAAPPGGVTLSIQSSDGSKALLGGGGAVGYPSIKSSLSAGLTTFSTFVQALTNTGSATVTVSAPGYQTATATVAFADSGFVIAGPNGAGVAFTAVQATSTPLTVFASRLDQSGNFAASQQLRGGLFARVPLSSDVTNVGEVSSAFAAFIGGMDHAAVQFLASATTLGTTDVMVGTPDGFSTPTTETSLAITVLP